MKTYNLLKIISKKILPEKLLNTIKSGHYYKTLRDFQLESEPDLQIVKNLVKDGEQVADISANIGIYTKFLSKFVGQNGKVLSFEPIPITYNFLSNNIKKLKLSNVNAFNFAVSDKRTELKMIIPSVIAGENFFRAMVTEDEKSEKVKSYCVKSILLDDYIDHFENCSFVKIDVEGHEENVLKGGLNFINKFKPNLLIEIGDKLEDENLASGRIRITLEKLGYTAYVNKENSLVKWQPGLISVNYFFLRDDKSA